MNDVPRISESGLRPVARSKELRPDKIGGARSHEPVNDDAAFEDEDVVGGEQVSGESSEDARLRFIVLCRCGVASFLSLMSFVLVRERDEYVGRLGTPQALTRTSFRILRKPRYRAAICPARCPPNECPIISKRSRPIALRHSSKASMKKLSAAVIRASSSLNFPFTKERGRELEPQPSQSTAITLFPVCAAITSMFL